MKLTTAILTSAPRTVETRYGTKTVIDAIRTDNNEPVTLWRPANDSYCQKLGKNSRVSVGIDHKNKPNLIEDEAITNLGQPLPTEPVPVKPVSRHLASNNPPTPNYPIPNSDPNFSPEKKAEMAEYVANLAQLYQHCQDKAENIALTPDDARAIGTTLFIQTVKHFNL